MDKNNIFRGFDDWRGIEEGIWRPRNVQRKGLGSREGDITSEDDLGFSSDAYAPQVLNYIYLARLLSSIEANLSVAMSACPFSVCDSTNYQIAEPSRSVVNKS